MSPVPIGDTISLAISLFVQYQGQFWGWYIQKIKTKPRALLLGISLSLFIFHKLNAHETDLESCYREVDQARTRIDRLKLQIILSQVGFVVAFYLFLGLAIPGGASFVVSATRSSWVLAIGSGFVVIFAALLGFYLLFKSMEWMRFAYIDLVINPGRSPGEVIKYCRQLVKNANVTKFDFISRLITLNLVSFPLALFGLVVRLITRFFPLIWLGFVPLIMMTSIVAYHLNLILNTCYYHKMLCLQEGWDLNLARGTMEIERKVKLLTPESVELEFGLAGIGNRALALLIDYLFLFFVLFCLTFVWIFVVQQLTREAGQWFNAFMFLLFFVIYTGYFVFFETVWNGQSPGKRFVKIRVIKANGRPVGIQQATMRGLLRVFDDFFSLGILLIVFSKTEKRLGDMAAQTIVVQEPRRAMPVAIKLSSRAERAEQEWDSLGITDRLSGNDFAVVKDYLQRRENFSPQTRSLVSQRLFEQLKNKLDLKEVPLGFKAEEHLEAIYGSFSRLYGDY